MGKYKVGITYSFSGEFEVIANSAAEAKEIVEKNCGMTMSSGIHTSTSDIVTDWEFGSHPGEKIRSVKKAK